MVGGVRLSTCHIRLDVYNSLPADLRQLVDKLSYDVFCKNYWHESDLAQSEAVVGMTAKGCKVVDWTAAEKKRLRDIYTGPVADEYAKKLDAQGLRATALLAKVREIAPKIVADNPLKTEAELRQFFLNQGFTEKDLTP